MATNWILVVFGVLGTVLGGALAAFGIAGLIRDGRRIAALVYSFVGTVAALFSIGLLLAVGGHPVLLVVAGVLTVVTLMLGSLIGYPLLVVFLLWSGVTVLRRESRSLANALALLAGLALLLLPTTLGLLAPPDTPRKDAGYLVLYAAHLTAVLVVAYVACAFAAFLAAALAYRRRRIRETPAAVVVLGSGLIDGRVPPLLAGRLDRGLEVQRGYGGEPAIIVSGGQGDDEPRAEGDAMREYLVEQGADPARVIAETRSRSTSENLRFSRRLLPDPDSPIVVVTSSYHVFRSAMLTRALGMRAHVVGSPTAWYYLPSAMLREFAAVVRDRFRLHAVCIGLIVAFAVLCTAVLVPATLPPGG